MQIVLHIPLTIRGCNVMLRVINIVHFCYSLLFVLNETFRNPEWRTSRAWPTQRSSSSKNCGVIYLSLFRPERSSLRPWQAGPFQCPILHQFRALQRMTLLSIDIDEPSVWSVNSGRLMHQVLIIIITFKT